MYKIPERQLEALRRYAAADASDPFAFARGMAHLRNRMGRPLQDGSDGHYDATEAVEMRKLPNGGAEYPVTVYRNVARI